MVGKIVVTFISPLIGRRVCGVLFGFIAAGALAAAAVYNSAFVGGVPVLVILLCCIDLRDRWRLLQPGALHGRAVRRRMGARSSGLGQAANGIGKILGPLSLALIAGSGNIVSPHATAEAVMPAILFLSGAMILVALSFVVLGVETHGVPMALDSDEEMVAAGRAEARERMT